MSAHGEQCAVPKSLTQYRIFIGSPGGLDDERQCFRNKLERFSALHAEHQSVLFHAVGWEDTVGGVGRPQALINEDLKQCDYAVFVLHDRWGSPTGGGYASGTEEEWALAEELYRDNKIRNIALFFKDVDPRRLRDPGKQLQSVLAFKKRIEEEKRYLFKQYGAISQFAETLEEHLGRWLRDHGSTAISLITTGATTSTSSPGGRTSVAAPEFDYWITEAFRLPDTEVADFAGAMFCAVKAIGAASSDIEWARARNVEGVAQLRLGRVDESITSFDAIANRFSTSTELPLRERVANALVNKGITLGVLDRSAEAIAVYDDLLARFGSATELPLRELVS
jgi:hypothetical protein